MRRSKVALLAQDVPRALQKFAGKLIWNHRPVRLCIDLHAHRSISLHFQKSAKNYGLCCIQLSVSSEGQLYTRLRNCISWRWAKEYSRWGERCRRKGKVSIDESSGGASNAIKIH